MPVAGSMSHCSGVRMVEHVDESQPMAIDAQPAIIPARCGCECKACLSSPPMLVAGSMSHCSGVWLVEHVDESQPMTIDAQPPITPARCRCDASLRRRCR
jgi:4'-phosphopantetheinyl transferase EntD